MVARTCEYHILAKRIPVDRLRLGTILSSIHDVTRLNSGKEPTIEEGRVDHWHDTNIKASINDTIKGEAGLQTEIVALKGLGGEAKVDGQRGNVDNYNFSAIDTVEFESVKQDYHDSGKAEDVQNFLAKSKYRPVFYITGIKVGRVGTNEDDGPTFDAGRAYTYGGRLSLGINIQTVASIGPNVAGSKDSTITQQYREHNDRIFAIRVRKLQYIKTSLFGLSGPREWVDEPYNDGAEMAGENKKEELQAKPDAAFDNVEEVGLDEEELRGYERVIGTNERDQQITYLVPEGRFSST